MISDAQNLVTMLDLISNNSQQNDKIEIIYALKIK